MIILGSTGSIGINTLNIARKFNLSVEVLVAGSNITVLNKQIEEFKPSKVVIANKEDIPKVKHNDVSFGEESILNAIENRFFSKRNIIMLYLWRRIYFKCN